MEIIVLVICIGLYFIPSFVAASNKKQNAGAIFALNFFLGWTLVGWVVALVWAMSKDVQQQPAAQVQVNVPAAPNVPTPLAPLPAAQKKCPDCAEMILAEAKKCRFCGHEFGPAIPLVGPT